MRVPCLVVDHDDTVVDSTATVHYPCFVEYMRTYHPGARSWSLEEYFLKNCDPGVKEFFEQDIGMDEEELRFEQEYWADYSSRHVPGAYPGIREVLCAQRERGGRICVVSHSLIANILRDWKANGLPEPDLVFGWDSPPEQRKPHPYPLERIMERFGYGPRQLLMLDDLKPGRDMAQAAGVPFAAAGWAYDLPQIERVMRRGGTRYFRTIGELGKYLAG